MTNTAPALTLPTIVRDVDGVPMNRPAILAKLRLQWTVRRKANLVLAVRGGLVTAEEARQTFDISPEELAAWGQAFDQAGLEGLRLRALASQAALVAPSAPLSPLPPIPPSQTFTVGRTSVTLYPHLLESGNSPTYVVLTKTEGVILSLLLRRINNFVSQEEFFAHLYPDRITRPNAPILKVFMCNLRKKLRRFALLPPIETFYGRGYRMAVSKR